MVSPIKLRILLRFQQKKLRIEPTQKKNFSQDVSRKTQEILRGIFAIVAIINGQANKPTSPALSWFPSDLSAASSSNLQIPCSFVRTVDHRTLRAPLGIDQSCFPKFILRQPVTKYRKHNLEIRWMEEILNQLIGGLKVRLIVYRVSTIQGGAGCFESTVSRDTTNTANQ